MNSARGVLSDTGLLDLSETELLEGWKDQNAINVKQIVIRRNNQEISTKHLILTFAASELPQSIETGYTKTPIRPYIPNPRRRFQCQRFGNGSQSCRARPTCTIMLSQRPCFGHLLMKRRIARTVMETMLHTLILVRTGREIISLKSAKTSPLKKQVGGVRLFTAQPMLMRRVRGWRHITLRRYPGSLKEGLHRSNRKVFHQRECVHKIFCCNVSD